MTTVTVILFMDQENKSQSQVMQEPLFISQTVFLLTKLSKLLFTNIFFINKNIYSNLYGYHTFFCIYFLISTRK